jgi:uncharacterized membrane protein YgdD (TMEM256/DUF423 family)
VKGKLMADARFFIIAGAIMGLLAVALGAFGAHALRGHFEANPALAENYQTAVQYHFVHALALLAVGLVYQQWGSSSLPLAGYAFLAGLLLFSGSLYLLSLTGQRWLGAITPLGGVGFLLGWALLAWGVWRA